jgi:DNA-binding CsgD family transcriptional regulator
VQVYLRWEVACTPCLAPHVDAIEAKVRDWCGVRRIPVRQGRVLRRVVRERADMYRDREGKRIHLALVDHEHQGKSSEERIRCLRAEGASYREIAELVRCAPSTAWTVCRASVEAARRVRRSG